MRVLAMSIVALMTGCGGGTSGPEDAEVRADAAVPDAAVPEPDAGEDGPRVYVHLRSTHEPVEHTPGTSGQTPRDWWSGIRSLHLLRTRDDPAPALVFTHGDGYVEASYADGADTVVGSAPIASLTSGSFTWARAVHTHVRFTIDATLHSSFGAIPGELEDLVVISDRTTIGGGTHDHGFYRYVFRAGGMEYPAEGSGFTVMPISGGGFDARLEEGETAYYFPAPLEVTDALDTDVHLIFEVNVHEGFRWVDEDLAGYEEGVFDATVAGTETIVQAGANGYRFFLE